MERMKGGNINYHRQVSAPGISLICFISVQILVIINYFSNPQSVVKYLINTDHCLSLKLLLKEINLKLYFEPL